MLPPYTSAVPLCSWCPRALAAPILRPQHPYGRPFHVAAVRLGAAGSSSRAAGGDTSVLSGFPPTTGVKNNELPSLLFLRDDKSNAVLSYSFDSLDDLYPSVVPHPRDVQKTQVCVRASPPLSRCRRPPGCENRADLLSSNLTVSGASKCSALSSYNSCLSSSALYKCSSAESPLPRRRPEFTSARPYSCSYFRRPSLSSAHLSFSRQYILRPFSSVARSLASAHLPCRRTRLPRTSASSSLSPYLLSTSASPSLSPSPLCTPASSLSPLSFSTAASFSPSSLSLYTPASYSLFPSSLCTRRPHVCLTFPFSLPSESSMKEVRLAPSSVCLMMKWCLDKIGAGSSSLRCFLPSEVSSRYRASLQEQQQQGERLLRNTNASLPIGNDAESVEVRQRSREEDVKSSSASTYCEVDHSNTALLERHIRDTSICSSSSLERRNGPTHNTYAAQCSAEENEKAVNPAGEQVVPVKRKRDFYEGWIKAELCLGSLPSKPLRDAFRRPYDEWRLRLGRLLELLDCFAADIAYHYCGPYEEEYSKTNILMVTASIQRLEFIDLRTEKATVPRITSSNSSDGTNCSDSSTGSCETSSSSDTGTHSSTQHNTTSTAASKGAQMTAILNVEQDLSMIGHVTQSGSSSVGIHIEIHQDGIVKGSVFFVMVAVHPNGRPAKIVPQLDVSSCSPEMQSLIQTYSAEFKARKALAAKIFSLVPPDPEESLFLHETWKKSLAGGSRIVWMRDTTLSYTELIQHETLTRYNRAFGGLVARRALELSFMTAQRFLRVLGPTLKGVDDIFFLEPLFVGDMLLMVSTVLWSTPDEIQIQVEAFREDPVSGRRQRTSLFTFVYDTVVREKNITRVCIVPPIYPRDYKECILFLEARRRYLMRREGTCPREGKV